MLGHAAQDTKKMLSPSFESATAPVTSRYAPSPFMQGELILKSVQCYGALALEPATVAHTRGHTVQHYGTITGSYQCRGLSLTENKWLPVGTLDFTEKRKCNCNIASGKPYTLQEDANDMKKLLAH